MKHLKRFNEEISVDTLKNASKKATMFGHEDRASKFRRHAFDISKDDDSIFRIYNIERGGYANVQFSVSGPVWHPLMIQVKLVGVDISNLRVWFSERPDRIFDVFKKKAKVVFEFKDIVRDKDYKMFFIIKDGNWVVDTNIYDKPTLAFHTTQRDEANKFMRYLKDNYRDKLGQMEEFGKLSVNSLMSDIIFPIK